jgi:hypothetical protein
LRAPLCVPPHGAAVSGRRPQRGAVVSVRSPGAELRTLLCAARARLLAVVVVWWVKEVRGSATAAYASLHKRKRPPWAFPTMQSGPSFLHNRSLVNTLCGLQTPVSCTTQAWIGVMHPTNHPICFIGKAT